MPEDMTKNHIVGVEQDLSYVASPVASSVKSDKSADSKPEQFK